MIETPTCIKLVNFSLTMAPSWVNRPPGRIRAGMASTFPLFIFPLQKAIHIRYTDIDWCKGLLEKMTKILRFPTGYTF